MEGVFKEQEGPFHFGVFGWGHRGLPVALIISEKLTPVCFSDILSALSEISQMNNDMMTGSVCDNVH